MAMADIKGRKVRETDLYDPVKAYLEGQGYVVKAEVGNADIVACRGEEPAIIIELKTGFSLRLFQQAAARFAVAEVVYIAVPQPTKGATENLRLARLLGLGVIFVRPGDGYVEVKCDPGPYRARVLKKRQVRLLREFERLRGDPNMGGSPRNGIVTAYRQDARLCAKYLAQHGPSKGAEVAKATGVPTATRVMRDNHYGWFVRVSRGVFALTDMGQKDVAS